MLTREREEEIAEVLKGYRIQAGRDALLALEMQFMVLNVAGSCLESGVYEIPDVAKQIVNHPESVLPPQLASLVTFKELQEFFDSFYYDLHLDEIHDTELRWSENMGNF